MDEIDADSKAEMPERRPRAGGGTTEGKPAARQTDTAHNEHAEDQIPVTLENALSRENMWRAYERVPDVVKRSRSGLELSATSMRRTEY
jgi:hypothetical protein